MTIALLCPTRGRPEQFKRMCESARATAKEVMIFGCEADQVGVEKYPSSQSYKLSDRHMVVSEGTPTVHKWNKLAHWAADHPEIKLFMLAADDIIFETPGWDKALLDHYNALENKIHVYSLQDSRDESGTPHPIVSRAFIEAMGYFLTPIFLHWFVDSWCVDIARSNGIFTHFKDFKLTHNKPSDKGQPDETHLGIRRMGWHERDTYVNATCQHFLEAEKLRLAKHMSIKRGPFYFHGMESV